VEAAEAEIDATEEYSRLVLVTLLSEVARNYVEARGYQNRILVARENIIAQEEALELTRVQFEGGLAGELDVAQAKAQLASTRSAVPTLESSFRQAVHRLGVLLGEYPTALVKDLETDGPIPTPPPEISVGLPSELLQRRPDIRRSERLLAAATAQIGVATADLFPRFYLLGSFGSQAYDFRNFLDHSSLFWSVGPSVSWPILDAGRLRAHVESQNAVQQEALAQYELTVLTALEEVENALTAYQREHLRRRHLSEAVEASRRALDLANERYVAGVADFLTVLDSERSLYETEDQLVQSTTATTLHAIALYKALGGGW
jgi:NodT family efflux transporter outer membrane factor (OMF) lipoprotein